MEQKEESLLGPQLQHGSSSSKGRLGLQLLLLNVRASSQITCHYSDVLWFVGIFWGWFVGLDFFFC